MKGSFVAALVDWRLFENPFINLADIFIPVTEFIERDQLFAQLPDLVTSLSQNVVGSMEEARKERLLTAWAAYDELYEQEISMTPTVT
jgi:anaerobic selenocysteine-containing dehydrogenase